MERGREVIIYIYISIYEVYRERERYTSIDIEKAGKKRERQTERERDGERGTVSDNERCTQRDTRRERGNCSGIKRKIAIYTETSLNVYVCGDIIETEGYTYTIPGYTLGIERNTKRASERARERGIIYHSSLPRRSGVG